MVIFNESMKVAMRKSGHIGLLFSGLCSVSHGAYQLGTDAFNYACDVKHQVVSSLARTEGFDVPPVVVSREQVERWVVEAALKNKLAPALLRGVILNESHYRASAKSVKGAIGLGQVMPANAGPRCGLTVDELRDERKNSFCTAKILSEDIASQKGSVIAGLQQ